MCDEFDKKSEKEIPEEIKEQMQKQVQEKYGEGYELIGAVPMELYGITSGEQMEEFFKSVIPLPKAEFYMYSNLSRTDDHYIHALISMARLIVTLKKGESTNEVILMGMAYQNSLNVEHHTFVQDVEFVLRNTPKFILALNSITVGRTVKKLINDA